MKVFRDRTCNDWWVHEEGYSWYSGYPTDHRWVRLDSSTGFELCRRIGGIEESSELEYVVLMGKAIVLECKQQ